MDFLKEIGDLLKESGKTVVNIVIIIAGLAVFLRVINFSYSVILHKPDFSKCFFATPSLLYFFAAGGACSTRAYMNVSNLNDKEFIVRSSIALVLSFFVASVSRIYVKDDFNPILYGALSFFCFLCLLYMQESSSNSERAAKNVRGVEPIKQPSDDPNPVSLMERIQTPFMPPMPPPSSALSPEEIERRLGSED